MCVVPLVCVLWAGIRIYRSVLSMMLVIEPWTLTHVITVHAASIVPKKVNIVPAAPLRIYR